MDILTVENLSSIKVANIDLINWSVRLSSRKELDELKRGWILGVVISASCEFYFIRVHKNLVQHPINNKSINSSEATLEFNIFGHFYQ